MAAKMPIIAITIINSMTVKPFCNDFIEAPSSIKKETYGGHACRGLEQCNAHAKAETCRNALILRVLWSCNPGRVAFPPRQELTRLAGPRHKVTSVVTSEIPTRCRASSRDSAAP